MLIAPVSHQVSIVQTADEELNGLAEVLSFAMRKLTARFGDPSLNVVIHNASVNTAPVNSAPVTAEESFHWHIEILPRLSRMAGFEAGTGFFINSVLPEKVAEQLRSEGI